MNENLKIHYGIGDCKRSRALGILRVEEKGSEQ